MTQSRAEKDPTTISEEGSGPSIQDQADCKYIQKSNCKIYEHLCTIEWDLLKLYNKLNVTSQCCCLSVKIQLNKHGE